ncbi:hypothetical protein [Anaeroselena agilis]|uniref:Uncharacterized protein n=1 Tax=Anaeroselena agilis TaxID=3063788 RepID=A0ABU3NXZ9_9FIRM|nr:hypothetical protein [Selenomonadales bacterium 4137-cl]
MLIVTTKVQPTNNQSRDKRRTTGKDKPKKQESFNKVLATEMTQPANKK